MSAVKELCKLRQLQRYLQGYEAEFLRVHGLSLPEGMLLCSLEEKSLKASELAERIGLKNSFCSKLLGRLEKAGYIFRAIDKEDKRCMYFSLSPSARQKIDEIQAAESLASPELLSIIDLLPDQG